MKRQERQKSILDLLVATGSVDLDDLSARFSVSKMTIHRDLDELENEGLLRKCRGGATIEADMRFESDYQFRARQGGEAKTAIARSALDFIEPGMAVMINDGSMAAVLGSMLPEKRPLTVITNNDAVIHALKMEKGITLVALGGTYSKKYNAYLGKLAEDAVSQLRADIAFISSPAISGTDVFHMDEQVVRVKKMMMASAAKSILLVHHMRFGHTALHKMASVDEFDAIVTDEPPTRTIEKQFEEMKVQLVLTAESGGDV